MTAWTDSSSNDPRRQDRRRRRVSLVLRERRCGFDRRSPTGVGRVLCTLDPVLLYLRGRPGALAALLVTVNALNLADFALTMNVLASGGGEMNPIMRSLLAAGPVHTAAFKLLAIMAATYTVWRCRRYRSALAAALILLSAFAAVFVYEVVGLFLLV